MDTVRIAATFAAALFLAFVHHWALYLHLHEGEGRKYWFSLADGVSITYIFLQLLPEIGHFIAAPPTPGERPYVLDLPGGEPVVGWLEHNPFFPLLIGFTLFYGLEKWIEHSSPDLREDQVNLSVHFWAHIVGLTLYKILLGYLLTRTGGWVSLLVFLGAMGLHFLVMDVHLLEMHKRAYTLFGRWVLIAAFTSGWLLGVLVDITPALLAMLMSFVAGSAVLMIIQDEFSDDHPTYFPAFLGSVAVYSLLMMAI